MASSSYYYNLYLKKKREVDDYEDNIRDLERILNRLGDMQGEIWDVNFEYEDLTHDLNKGVRHNSIFTSQANTHLNKKEKSVSQDRNLSRTQDGLEDEISRLNQLLNQAISSRDYYYSKYKAKKAEERAELARKLFGGG
ncbi:hypothetical protein [Ornithinibacillus halotolerans]|uniref:Uncharacterized protein n=1 Tax=Ornithinibacillus halotolerans TaxID=1274357 RepID=A0A916S2D6_9BACI|nr:hypothetical protein [Ornithinibacillus halotolerans]GGA79755.1 hypothetical protein GCM10008025_23940 [Ornithinibacillus halotolerans]